jgi:choloylglycine hydrolase
MMSSALYLKAEACTAAYHAPSSFMLKSYDWHDGAGDLYFNPRGIARTVFHHEAKDPDVQSTPYAWESRFASVSFNQYGRGFPNGGVNESGLAIEVLWLNETQAPAVDQRPYLNELEWVQYVLDTHTTVPDVIRSAARLRISPIHGQVHYMTCDAQGVCATLELLKGQLVVHTGDELPHPALTNHTYEQGLSYLTGLKKSKKPKGRGSLARFVIAAQTATHTHPQTLPSALKALKRVEISGYTKWQIAYDLKHRRVAFSTSSRPNLRQVSLDHLIKMAPDHARGCSAVLTYNLSRRDQGEINQHFKRPQPDVERQSLRERFQRLGLGIRLADLLSAHGAQCEASSSPKSK